MKNIKIDITYNGQNYYGMQKQKNKPTIQGEIEKALKDLFLVDLDLNYAGRTDRGVSAKKMTANFFVDTKIKGDKIKDALNVRLPEDIRILSSEEVSLDFNSRHSAKLKTYCYSLYESKVNLPLYYFESQFKNKLDYLKMKKAIKFLIGTHDFSSFVSSGCEIEDKTRTIKKAKITRQKIEGINHYKFYFTGNGFLYNQVRIMVGTIILAGLNKIAPKEIKNILYNGDTKCT